MTTNGSALIHSDFLYPCLRQYISMFEEFKSKLLLLCPHSELAAEKPTKQNSNPGLVLAISKRAGTNRHPRRVFVTLHAGA